jgi:hypothetical protein
MVIAAVAASPNTVQLLALIAAVVFAVAALISFLSMPRLVHFGLVSAGLCLLAIAIIYLV